MKKIIIYILLFIVLFSCSKDELNVLPPAIDWEKNIISTSDDDTLNTIDYNIYALESTIDNGFVIAINGDIRKYSSESDSLWQKSYSESVKVVQRLSNNEYLLCGSNSTNLWMSKVNQDFDVIWETLVPFDEAETAFFKSIAEASDGIVLGIRENTGRLSHSQILKLDNNGNLLWANNFPNMSLAEIHGIEVANDGNIFIAGGANEAQITDSSPWFAKMNNNGNIIEQEIFVGDSKDYFAGIQQRSNGDFVVLIKDYYNTDIAFIKDGEIENRDALGRSDFSTIDEINNGEWMMIGEYNINYFMGENDSSTAFAKLDDDGQRIWQTQFGNYGYSAVQNGVAVCQLTDGSYIFLMTYYDYDDTTYILTKTETN